MVQLTDAPIYVIFEEKSVNQDTTLNTDGSYRNGLSRFSVAKKGTDRPSMTR